MSDFIYSSSQMHEGVLAEQIARIYHKDPPEVVEFHGLWGSLAVSKNKYKGFLPYENDKYVMIVIGGPLLCYRDNSFLTLPDSNQATFSIYQKWIEIKSIQWDEDLSGPFAVFLVDKENSCVKVVTDLMAFIPVYILQEDEKFFVGTHTDALARTCQRDNLFDDVSLADFVLNDVVTFPYTLYKDIKQLYPGSQTSITKNAKEHQFYWQPSEHLKFKSLSAASDYLRVGISNFVHGVTKNMERVAHFISAGEDSRSLAGILPRRLKRDSYVFLDQMNREGRIAEKIAKTYGAEFSVGYRKLTHYIDILPEANDLIGTGHQYIHAHSLRFDRQFNLANYDAVFGGFLSDTLLKGHHVKLFKGYGRVPFLPQIRSRRGTPIGSRFGALSISLKHTNEVIKRQNKHYAFIKNIRPRSTDEWFNFYPASMHNDFPNFYCTRRLFKSYEPFMCKEAVKVSACVPTSWKLNRRLFNHAMKPYLNSSKWMFHADGRLPYFSWWVNMPLQFFVWFYRHSLNIIGLNKGNQGPWGDWGALLRSNDWRQAVKSYSQSNSHLEKRISQLPLEDLLLSHRTTTRQKFNLMQLLYGTANERLM